MGNIKKRYTVLIIVLVIFILFNGFRWFAANQEKEALMDNTLLYLQDRGYDTDAVIDEKYIVDIGQDERMYAVVVAFKDESDVHYLYTYEKDTNQIIQYDVVNSDSNQSLKHQES